jgi:hypothetical protein
VGVNGQYYLQLGTTNYSSFNVAVSSISDEQLKNPPWPATYTFGATIGFIVIANGASQWVDGTARLFHANTDSAGSSASEFLTLTDTPGSYSGQSLSGVRVNAGETALEFYNIGAGGGGGSPAHFEGNKTTTTAGVGTTPVKVVHNVTSITGDGSFFSYSGGDLTVNKDCIIFVDAMISTRVAFGSNGPTSRITIAKNSVPLHTMDSGAYSTTNPDTNPGVSDIISCLATDTIQIYVETLNESVDVFQNLVRVFVLEDLS